MLLKKCLKQGNAHTIFSINLLMEFAQVCVTIILIGTISIMQKVLVPLSLQSIGTNNHAKIFNVLVRHHLVVISRSLPSLTSEMVL